jgi:uncharacterized protein (TIGR02001 family)
MRTRSTGLRLMFAGGLMATATFLPISNAHAEGEEAVSPHSFSATVTGASQYVFRGITQTDEEFAIQGSMDYAHASGAYVGAWASNIDFGDGTGASSELDVYGGFANSVSGIDYDVGFIYYNYPGVGSSRDFDYVEAAFSVGHDFGIAATTVGVNWSPDNFGESGDAVYVYGDINVPFPGELPLPLSLDMHIGHQDIDKNAVFGFPDYMDWSFGLSTSVQGFDLSVAYIDTDLKNSEGAEDVADSRAVFTVSRSF